MNINLITTLVTNIVLLLIMLIGLLCLGCHQPGMYGLGRGEHRPIYGIWPYTSGHIMVTVCLYPYPYSGSKEP